MNRSNAIVLDAWAIMAYLEDEPPAEKIGILIADALEQNIPILMTVVNVGEVWYSVARRRSARDADQALRWLDEIGIDPVNADITLSRSAARYKVKGGISYADCFAAALAKQTNATLVTGDPEFKQLENEIAIEWL